MADVAENFDANKNPCPCPNFREKIGPLIQT